MNSSTLTVVMPVYRESEKHLRLAIESILGQTLKQFRLIIILDDPLNAGLKAVIDGYAGRDGRIASYVNEANMGCPKSKDRGIRLADTEYVAIMDADDVAREQRLEKQLHKIVKEDLDIVAGCVMVVDDAGEPLYRMDRLPLRHDDIVKKMKVNNCMPHPTWMLKRDAYIKLGGYADMQGCEDYDFLIRAIKGGCRLGTVGEILLDYRLSPKSVSRNNLYRQYLMMRYLQDKHYAHKHNYQSFDDICRQKYTEKRAGRYAEAALHFESALAHRGGRRYFKMAASLFMAAAGSGDYCLKMLRYAAQNRQAGASGRADGGRLMDGGGSGAKKILFIIWSYTSGGGSESLLTSIASRLDAEKYEVSIIECLHAGTKEEPAVGGVRVLPPLCGGGAFARLFRMALIYLFPRLSAGRRIRGGYDLYVAFNYLVPSLLLPEGGRNLQWIQEDVRHGLSGKRMAWRRKRQDRALDRADKIVVVSDHAEKAAEEMFPRHKGKLVRLYNGVDIGAVRAKSLEHTDVRLESPSVLFVGRLEEGKDPLRCLDVLDALRARHGAEAHLYLLGEGRLAGAVAEKAGRLGLSGRVHLLGYLENPFPVMRQCDAVCVLSRSEGFGLCWLEGLALGKPFVATPTGAAEYLSAGGSCGYVVETDEEAADAVWSIINGDKGAIALECEKSAGRFGMDGYMKKVEGLLDDAIGGSGRAAGGP